MVTVSAFASVVDCPRLFLCLPFTCSCSLPTRPCVLTSFDCTTPPRVWVLGPAPSPPAAHQAMCADVFDCRARRYANFLNMTSWVPHLEVRTAPCRTDRGQGATEGMGE
eukprot:365447-Chlamydomonas_euryale.AAC.12